MAQFVIVGLAAVVVTALLGSIVYAAYALASICDWNEPAPNAAFKGGRDRS